MEMIDVLHASLSATVVGLSDGLLIVLAVLLLLAMGEAWATWHN